MELSEEIEKLSFTDLISMEQMYAAVPEFLLNQFEHQTLLNYIQHAVDYDGRFVNVGTGETKNILAAIAYSFFSDKKIMIRDRYKNMIEVNKFLKENNVTSKFVSTDRDFDPESIRVAMLPVQQIPEEIISSSRKWVMFTNSICTDFTDKSRSYVYDATSPSQNDYFHSINSVDITIPPPIQSYVPQAVDNKITSLIAAMSTLFQGMNLSKLFDVRKPVASSRQGVRITNPYHISRGFGVHYGLHVTQEPND
jgi:hypothetical protein